MRASFLAISAFSGALGACASGAPSEDPDARGIAAPDAAIRPLDASPSPDARPAPDASPLPDASTAPEHTARLAPIADAEVTMAAPSANRGTQPTAGIHSELYTPSQTGYIYLRFDLSSLPAGADIFETTLEMMAYQGYAWGDDGNVYLHFVASDTWTETDLTWNTRPTESSEVLGFWWLWYDFQPSDKIGATSDPALLAGVRREFAGDRALSVMLRSRGYDTSYRTREHATETQRPSLTVRYRTAP